MKLGGRREAVRALGITLGALGAVFAAAALMGLAERRAPGTPVLIGLGFFYFVPALVAHLRRHRNEGAVSVLNLLLGWTVLGWIIALIWACTANTRPKPTPAAPATVAQPTATPAKPQKPKVWDISS